ncbi:ABC-type branched-chain amino acid transport systems periplasmic component [Gaiella occulta]|uniref:ABC-type branched-chain amino acid transport systems periplasmic component n=1 Tax=Gaiella occulta TaxID=1002870 RepID=A0A7M2YXZ2_9ACTN|nr:substrate-binding domain-containing protein [Gaiella occulta]RDI75017.1 ABC-type branched-chain amino acid transport systems periplasmic component [Gaiella occulta]
MQRWHKIVGLVAALALLAGVGATAQAARTTSTAEPVKVGIIYSRTGFLAAYGAEYIQGLRYGLAYATRGTNAVGGRPIELTLVDDAGDPAKAVSAAKDLIGKGYKILAGTVSSGVALQLAPLAAQNQILYISGPAATDALTGINRYTFRSGRQSYQDVLAASSYLGGGVGKNVTVFAQDSAFGLGNFLAVNQVMGNLGGQKVSRVLVPLSAQDFTPFAQQVKQQKTDLLFVAWAGTTAPAMWRALEQQGIFAATDKVVTGLAERATYATFGLVASQISFLSHYVYTAPKNKVNDYLVRSMRKRNQVPDLFTPDGFVAGQMIVRALEKGSATDVDRMIAALEGWSFTGPKGQQTIRASDHAMLQPMFQVKLTQKDGKYVPVVLKSLRAKYTAPPEKK